MLCQNCKKNQANTHVKQVINGKTTEMDLCHDCAVKLGFGNPMASMSDMFDIGPMMSSFLGMPSMPSMLAREEKCPGCGITFSQITKTGKAGCAQCYTAFYDKLLPSIKRIHGNTVHTGKRLRTARLPNGTQQKSQTHQKSADEMIKELSAKLSNAIKAQEFEQAAELRDRINELKSERGAANNG